MKRRTFVGGMFSASVAAGVSNRANGTLRAPSDRIRIGLMGCGGRQNQLIPDFAARDDVDIACVCDVDQAQFSRIVSVVDEIKGKMPRRETDFRKMFDDPEIDAVVIAVNHHWHALATIMACQAGKHVYVEKPMATNVWEGRKMVEAARKYDRVVQVGTQNRSYDYHTQAADFIREGHIGEIHQVRIVNQMGNAAKGGPPKERAVPEGFDYDMYCGPAPMVPWVGRWIYRQLWDFSVGGIWDNALHQTDVVRWVLGLGAPKAVFSAGGVYQCNDGRETPDTLVTTFEYDNLLMHLHASNCTPYREMIWKTATAKNDDFPDWQFYACALELEGTEGTMFLGRHGGGWVAYDKGANVIKQVTARTNVPKHIGNFIECCRTGKRPNADVEKLQETHILLHASNTALRVGQRRLQWDAANEQFLNDDEANALLKRKYRAPWIVPDQV
jgi:predicted dehydrogenase